MKKLENKDFIEDGKAIKKPIAVSFMILEEEMEVKTLEGSLKGKKGDYVIRGVKGEIYPVDSKIFEETYDISLLSEGIELVKTNCGLVKLKKGE